MKNNKILVVDKLNKYFNKSGKLVKVLDNVTFDVYEKDFLGIIGESGSGKSTTGKCIIRLYSSSSGDIIFDDNIINQKQISKKQKQWLYQNMSMIFQDPMSSLNSRKNVLSIISEPLIINKTIKKEVQQKLNECETINNFFQNTYKWQEFNLTKEYLIPFYENNIKNFEESISWIKTSINLDQDSLIDLKDKIIDIENAYKSNLKYLQEYTNFIKVLSDYNYEQFINDHLEELEIDYRHASENLSYSKKLLKAPEKYWILKDEEVKLKQQLQDYLDEVDLIYKEQYKTRLRSIKLRYINEIKLLKQNAATTDSITNNIQWKVNELILKDTLKAIQSIKKQLYVEEEHVEKVVQYINEKIKAKYEALNEKVSYLDVLSKKIDNLTPQDVEAHDKEAKNIFNQYRELYAEVSNDFNRFKHTDFVQDEDIRHLILRLEKKSQEKYYEISRNIDELEQNISDIHKEITYVQYQWKNGQYKNYEKFNRAKREFEQIDQKRTKWANEDNLEFASKKIPLIKEQKDLIANYQDKFSQLQKELKKIVLAKIKAIKKHLNSQKNVKEEIKIIEKELKLKWLTIDAINFEVETYFQDLDLYRKLRSTNKIYLKLQSKKLKNSLIRKYVYSALEEVGLKNEHAYRYPHEFSGGQRQRIVIARALISKPKLVIADEPISALDVSIQAQVINIMKSLAIKHGITFLFIAHDLSMVRYTSNRLIILHKGKIVEKGNTDEVFNNPIHPYTKSLIKASPELSKIHIDLASFSSKLEYDKDYSSSNVPEFFRVPNEKEHYVYATEDQFKKWIK